MPGRQSLRRATRTVASLLSGATPADKGVWLPGPVIPDPLGPSKELPFQPWARALFADRRTHQLEPHARCKPSGVARVFLTPYGVEITELAELKRVYIFDIGGPHTFRTIYLDGRAHPKDLIAELLRPLHRPVGRRHAGRSIPSDSTRASGSIAAVCPAPNRCTRWSASRAPT